MKRISEYILIALAMVALSVPSYGAAGKKAKAQKAKAGTEAAKPAPRKKNAYSKFVNAKGTVKYPGKVTLYMDKAGQIWAEIPDSLLGRDFLFDQITKADGDPTATDGRCIAKNLIYRIERRDSSILFTTSDATVHAEDAEDEGVSNAIRQSVTRTTVFRFPVKCVGKDSSSFVFNVTKVLTPSAANTNLSGLTSGAMRIISGTFDAKKSGKPYPITFGNSFGIKREASFNCTGAVSIFQAEGVWTSTVQTTLTLLPEAADIPLKKADTRIGTYNFTRTVFSSTGKNVNDKVISRWDLSEDKFIKVYVDTLFSPVMYDAVREGLMAWNRAFIKAGVGARIVAMPYEPGVNVDDPLVTSVKFAGGTGSGISGVIHRHENGQILSFQINVPRYLSDFARKDASMLIGDVDDRFRFQREQDEAAVAEIARARVMKLTGNCLGLANNMAGSRAYTPAQLRSPEFTGKHGISASVTDDVLFNCFARPGDKERGLVLINNRLGEYDYYAIDWIYGDGQVDNRPEHLFVPATRSGWQDPRGIERDLSSDVLASYDAQREHLKNCIPAMKEWKLYEASNVDESEDLLIDWIFLNNWYAMAMLSSQVGGVGANEMRQEGGRPKFEPVPAEIQRQCTKKMMNLVEEMSYIQQDKEFFQLFGPNKNASNYIKNQQQGMLMIASRLPRILAACDLAGSEFTAEEFMDMVFDSTFKGVRKGHLEEMDDNNIAMYINTLANMSTVTKVNLKETRSGHRLLATDREPAAEIAPEFRANISLIPDRYYGEAELIAYKYLQKSADLLKLARNLFADEAQKARIDYLVYLADAALGQKKK